MDKETARYIVNHYSHLLTVVEQLAITHASANYKLENSTTNNLMLEKVFREKGWTTSYQDVLDFLKDGYENFEINIANRILSEHKDRVFLNYCPKCGKLARTPDAQQCRHCGHDWHETNKPK